MITRRKMSVPHPPLPAVLDLAWYLGLKDQVRLHNYGRDIDWAQSLKPVSDPFDFWAEYSWVVINSGMKNQIAEQIWKKVRPVVMNGGSAGSVFGHKGKCAAIDYVWKNRRRLLVRYHRVPNTDKLEWIGELPWIGEITKWHLAKNLGFDCAKPDRHLVRIAGEEGTHALCARLAEESGDRIATVDVVIWRAANLKLV